MNTELLKNCKKSVNEYQKIIDSINDSIYKNLANIIKEYGVSLSLSDEEVNSGILNTYRLKLNILVDFYDEDSISEGDEISIIEYTEFRDGGNSIDLYGLYNTTKSVDTEDLNSNNYYWFSFDSIIDKIFFINNLIECLH